MASVQTVTILGSTGSIGLSTLDVIRSNSQDFNIYALTARRQSNVLLQQCLEFHPKYAVLLEEAASGRLREVLLQEGCSTEVLCGSNFLDAVSSAGEVDTVVAAIVGAAGLKPTYAAVCAGKKVLLANKEALVMSGQIFTDAVRDNNAELLPVDSEHNAIFQCMPLEYESLSGAGIRKILLTGSGGPFRKAPISDLKDVTPEQACAHPNWSMGRKISVDSATMMNKGLEFIEACWLFEATPDQIDVVVHPQSIVHSMVEYIDGSVLAQMGNPDMRTPIAHSLAWPRRMRSNVSSLDFFTMGALEFEKPDYNRFPCLKYAIDAIKLKGAYPAALNAANEEAVESFLNGVIRFTDIAAVNAEVLDSVDGEEPQTLDDVLSIDHRARLVAKKFIQSVSK